MPENSSKPCASGSVHAKRASGSSRIRWWSNQGMWRLYALSCGAFVSSSLRAMTTSSPSEEDHSHPSPLRIRACRRVPAARRLIHHRGWGLMTVHVYQKTSSFTSGARRIKAQRADDHMSRVTVFVGSSPSRSQKKHLATFIIAPRAHCRLSTRRGQAREFHLGKWERHTNICSR